MGEATAARLVVVEDHELLTASLALALAAQGVEVHAPAGLSEPEVVEAVARQAPVLVLLDLDLGPDRGSGLELIGPITGAGGRVLMMTGVVEADRLAACVEAGAVGIVPKSAGFAELVDAVRRAMAGEDLMTPADRQQLLSRLRDARRADRERLAPFATLSPRERAVLAGLVAGESAEAIAARSYVSLATVRTQIRAILLKLGVRSQLAAVALARSAGWPPPGDEG